MGGVSSFLDWTVVDEMSSASETGDV